MSTFDTIEHFRTTLNNRAVIGPFSKTHDPALIEVMGHAGMDFVILDTEHGPNGYETLQHLIRAANCVDLMPIVRVPGVDEKAISTALDCGAGGIQVPNVKTVEHVQAVIKAAKYAPLGERGVCRYVRAADYSSKDKQRYFGQANDALVIVQVEGQEGMDNLDGILGVDGIDILFIGPYDLSQSLGRPGEVTHPDVIAAMQSIVNKAQARGITVGTFCDDTDNMCYWRELGIRYLSISVDVGIFYEACRGILSAVQHSSENVA